MLYLIALALKDEFLVTDPKSAPSITAWSYKPADDHSALTAYDDVERTHWSYAALDYFVQTGAIEGYSVSFFDGDRTLTRYEFALASARVLDYVGTGLATKPEDILAAALLGEFGEQLDILILLPMGRSAEMQAAVTALSGREFVVDSPYNDVNPRSWDYKALDYLVRQQVLEGYPKDFFGGERTLTRYEITQATARLLDTLGPQYKISPELLLAEALRDKYRDQAKLLSEALDRSMGDSIGCILSSEVTGALAFLADGKPEDAASNTNAYTEVTAGHWSYYALDYLAEKGTLEGYPKDFFDGVLTLTRFEFACAVARLLDTISSRPQEEPEGAWSVDLILAYALREEFDDQLAELSRIINEPGSIVQ